MPDLSTAVAEAPVTTPSTTTTEPVSQPVAQPSISDMVSEASKEAQSELTKPAEVPVAETQPVVAETKPAVSETKPTEVAKPADATPPNPLDKLGPLPAEKITAALTDAPPEVKAFLDSKGLTLDALSQVARDAAETGQYKAIFPTLKDGEVALEGAQNFWKLDSALPAVQTIDDFDKFMMETLVPMSYIRDAQGNPIPNPDVPGAFQNDGSIGKLIDFSAAVRDNKISELADMLLKSAATDEDKDFATNLKGAVEFVGNFIKAGYKQPGSKEDPATLPEWARKEIETAKRTNAEAKATNAKTSQEKQELSESKVMDQTYTQLKPMIEEVVNKASGLSDKLKQKVVNMAWQELTEAMKKNGLYTRRRDNLSPSASDYEQQRVALNISFMKPELAKTLADWIAEVGGPVVDANKVRQDKIDSQSKASAMEPKTSGTTRQSFPAASTTDQAHAKAMELARAENPNAREGGAEYWRAVMKLEP